MKNESEINSTRRSTNLVSRPNPVDECERIVGVVLHRLKYARPRIPDVEKQTTWRESSCQWRSTDDSAGAYEASHARVKKKVSAISPAVKFQGTIPAPPK